VLDSGPPIVIFLHDKDGLTGRFIDIWHENEAPTSSAAAPPGQPGRRHDVQDGTNDKEWGMDRPR
jgi:hypothetical protein